MAAVTPGVAGPAPTGTPASDRPDPTAEPAGDQRARILDAALRLMGDQGAAGASMRQLAAACELHVATLYHYFPSKADLLRSVIEDRRYLDRLAAEEPPVDPDAPARARLSGLLTWLWERTTEEEAVWRLLIGESIRGEAAAAEAATALVAALDGTLARWLADHVPELGDRVERAARLVRGQVFALVVEQLALGAPADAPRHRAEDLATLLLPNPA